MRYSLFMLLGLTLFSSSIISKNEEAVFSPLKDHEVCEIVCSKRNTPCLGVLEKTVYEGKTEKGKVLSKQVISFCLEYPEESNPT